MDGQVVATARTAPLLGLRVSWGSLLSGTLVMLAVSTVLWLLALAVVLVSVGPSEWRGALITLGIVAIVTTLIGACCGGWVAGWLHGSGVRRLGAIHGLMGWALAFLLSLSFACTAFFGVMRFATRTAVQATTTAVSATAQAAGGAAAGGGNVTSGAVRFLEGLGYSPAEASRMVSNAQQQVQQLLRRGQANAPTGEEAAATARDAVAGLMGVLGTSLFIYWGTWILALLLATAFGGLGATRVRRRLPEETVGYQPEPTPPTRPLRPREV